MAFQPSARKDALMKYVTMLMLMGFVLLLVSTLLFAADPSKEYSTTMNPNGVWSYGYSTTLGSPFILYTAWRINGWNPRDDYWYNPNGQSTPTVEHNFGDPWTPPDGCGFWVPDVIFPVPGYNSAEELSIVRCTAPIAGTYHVRGYFVGVSSNGCGAPETDADVHVRWNTSQALFDSKVIGFGHVAFFNFMQPVRASDTLDFEVGTDGRIGNDYRYGTG